MDNFLGGPPAASAFNVAISSLDRHALEWWTVHKQTEEGTTIQTWPPLKDALIKRFQTLNKEKTARHKQAEWRKIKDVVQFNSRFQKIILDIPDISLWLSSLIVIYGA